MKKLIYMVLAVVILVKLGFLSSPFPSEPEFVKSYENKVVLYAASWCGYCQKTRELFAKNNIAYIEHDIEKSAMGKAEYDQLNGRGVPLILMGGEVIRGYDPEGILRLAKKT